MTQTTYRSKFGSVSVRFRLSYQAFKIFGFGSDNQTIIEVLFLENSVLIS